MPPPLLQMSGIEKRFPGVHALKGVNLTLQKGEVLALMGENGAGKSTLMKVLGGAHLPDQAAHRQIDPSADNNYGHANGDNGNNSDLIGDIEEVVLFKKIGPLVWAWSDSCRCPQLREIQLYIFKYQPIHSRLVAENNL